MARKHRYFLGINFISQITKFPLTYIEIMHFVNLESHISRNSQIKFQMKVLR
jgi:hypothetical protein